MSIIITLPSAGAQRCRGGVAAPLAAPRDEVERRLGALRRMRRRDVVGIAGEHDEFGIANLLLPSPRVRDRGEAAFLGRDDQTWTGDLRYIGADIGAGDRAHEAELGGEGRAAHEFA